MQQLCILVSYTRKIICHFDQSHPLAPCAWADTGNSIHRQEVFKVLHVDNGVDVNVKLKVWSNTGTQGASYRTLTGATSVADAKQSDINSCVGHPCTSLSPWSFEGGGPKHSFTKRNLVTWTNINQKFRSLFSYIA